MIKRKIVFGTYDTAANGWTLTGWKLGAAGQKTNYVDRPGGDGSWDLSTALTDGIMRYDDRTLTATFECSEGDRMSREAKIRHMINTLDGMRLNIELPDDPFHYVTGRLQVTRGYNDLAHASVSVSATCEPWKYSNAETVVTLTASTAVKSAQVVNGGRRAVVPVIKVTGGTVTFTFGAASAAFSTGTHKWPDLLLTPGAHELKYSGAGSFTLTFREAVLE